MLEVFECVSGPDNTRNSKFELLEKFLNIKFSGIDFSGHNYFGPIQIMESLRAYLKIPDELKYPEQFRELFMI